MLWVELIESSDGFGIFGFDNAFTNTTISDIKAHRKGMISCDMKELKKEKNLLEREDLFATAKE